MTYLLIHELKVAIQLPSIRLTKQTAFTCHVSNIQTNIICVYIS
jgi:hypothetical protein